MAKKLWRAVTGAVTILLCFFYLCFKDHFSQNDVPAQANERVILDEYRDVFHSRSLLAAANYSDASLNCTPPAIEQFPQPLISYRVRREGALVLHILVSLYMFLGLAIVCDEYFVPSLERICEVCNIQSDVAGATFMAAGSSAPELATAVIAVFIAKNDIGIGTVVGSAVYNIAFVIGICGLFAGRTIILNWWPLFRDCVFYLISIAGLLFALRDERVTWLESVILLLLYMLYILFMVFNRKIEAWCSQLKFTERFRHKGSNSLSTNTYKRLSETLLTTSAETELENKAEENDSRPQSSASEEEEAESKSSHKVFSWQCILSILSFPLNCALYITVPDCRKQKRQNFFFITFLMSCVWISFFSYILVWMLTIVGYTLHIKDTIMGLTILAAGVSIPDAISSLLVVRQGLGDMAVSNAVGSNVFDILICLGFPWFLQTVVVNPGSSIPVSSRGLTYSTVTLFLTVIFLLMATYMNNWKLDRKYGAILLLWYCVFMVIATMYELNVFGIMNLPMCPSDF